MTHADDPNAAPEFNVGDVVCISTIGDRHQDMTGRITEVQPNGTCRVHIPRTDANGLASDDLIYYSASQLKSGNAADLKPASTPDIFQRLKLLHQIDYPTVHIALSYYPPNMLFFAQWFKGRTLNQVLQQFEKWDELLAKDLVPALAGKLKPKPKVQQRLRGQLEKWDIFLGKDCVLALHVELKSKVQQWLLGQFRQLDKSDELLAKDFSLALDAELKSEVQQFIRGIEAYVVNAILEANPSVGLWDLKVILLPTGETAEGRPIYINPSTQIVAIHRETNEKRTAPFTDSEMSRRFSACKEAFEKLGFWDSLWKGDPSPKFVTRRTTQGWPFFTQLIIPRLYDLLVPHYESPGHHWARHGNAGSTRLAEYPQVLLVDMLEILRLEYKAAFEKTTIPQLKSAVQQHVESKK